eukprot:487415-Prorocentrum_minimum.AAC.3
MDGSESRTARFVSLPLPRPQRAGWDLARAGSCLSSVAGMAITAITAARAAGIAEVAGMPAGTPAGSSITRLASSERYNLTPT